MPEIDDGWEPVRASAAMRELDRKIRAIADKDVTVLLVGESGSGKEIMARRLHHLSSRSSAPFVPINCTAIPESLFESELFGHERGAFTGASERAQGKVEAAEGGTLFLDEIGELPTSMQVKLLRFLEHRRFMRVGGATKLSVNTRVVCATLRNLQADVHDGRFRADLFYRVQGITLSVPPLRERPEDFPILVRQLLASTTLQHATRPPKIPRAAMLAMKAYAWPGNVRELKNTIELCALLRAGRKVRVQDLPESVRLAAPRQLSPSGSAQLQVSLDRSLDLIMLDVIRAALALEGGNRTRAAARLGVSVRTIQRCMVRCAGNGLTSRPALAVSP